MRLHCWEMGYPFVGSVVEQVGPSTPYGNWEHCLCYENGHFHHPPPRSQRTGTVIPTTPMTTVPILCNQSSPNATSRNITTPEDLSIFFEVMHPDNQMARPYFQKTVKGFEARATRKQVGVHYGQWMWWTRDGWDTKDNRGPNHQMLKQNHYNCIVCRIFFVLLQKVLWRYCRSNYGENNPILFHNCTTKRKATDYQYRLHKRKWNNRL